MRVEWRIELLSQWVDEGGARSKSIYQSLLEGDLGDVFRARDE